MKKVTINNHVIELYDSIESLPIRRYNKFNKYLLFDNEVGASFEDYLKRSQKTTEYLKTGLYEEALQELSNRTEMVFNAYNNYIPKDYALAVLVYSIDGKVYSDYTDAGLDEIINILDEIGFSRKQANEETESLKKKVEMELSKLFPNSFTNSDLIRYNNNLIAEINLKLTEIETNKDLSEEIFECKKDILKFNPPNSWNINVAGNKEREYEVEFDKFIISVQEHSKKDIKIMSVYEFYVLLEVIKEKSLKNGNSKLQ